MTGRGTYTLSSRPGIGHDPSWERIEALTVKKWESA
jgi:hypothetical protein